MFSGIIKSLRLHQWTKNVAVLAAIIFDRQLNNPEALTRSIAGVFLFCLLSSSIYIINDIVDIESDRQHPKKRNRPIASGKLPVSVAIVIAILLVIISIPVSFWLSTGFGIITLIYFIQNLAYSNWLKHIPVLDVLLLATGFVLRVAGGVSLIEVERFSPWLYIVTTCLALYLGFGKRRTELITLAANANAHRKVLNGYSVPFLDQLITIVSSITIISYSFYTFSAPNLPDNHIMMLTIPFVLYGIFRYLYLMQIKQLGGAPDELLFKDRPLLFTVMLWGIAVLIIFYFL